MPVSFLSGLRIRTTRRGRFTPRGFPLKGVGRFEISVLPRCRSMLRCHQQNATGAKRCATVRKRCATVRKRCGCFDSVIKVQCPPQSSDRGGLFRTTRYVCFCGDVRGSVPDTRTSPAPSLTSSNATLCLSKVLVSSDLFASSPLSNATLFFDSSEKAPASPACSRGSCLCRKNESFFSFAKFITCVTLLSGGVYYAHKESKGYGRSRTDPS